jgi:hypothetical protein
VPPTVSQYCAHAADRLPWVSIAPFGSAGRAAGVLQHRDRLVGSPIGCGVKRPSLSSSAAKLMWLRRRASRP